MCVAAFALTVVRDPKELRGASFDKRCTYISFLDQSAKGTKAMTHKVFAKSSLKETKELIQNLTYS